MSKREPVAQRRYRDDDSRPQASWAEAWRRLEGADTFWLATSRQNGRPHVMPLLAVALDGRLYFCAGPSTQKARNLARDQRCVLSTATRGMDLVVEGRAHLVSDDPTLERAAGVYLSKYGWDAEPRDGAFYGEGAPTAGRPPLNLYELMPDTVFGFGTDDSLNAMRWSFERD